MKGKKYAENLKMHKRYLVWCANAEGKCESTVRGISNVLYSFALNMGNRSYKKLTDHMIVNYKDKIRKEKSVATYCSHVSIINKFLRWLMSQHGYKRAITADLVAYMRPTGEERRIAQIPAERNIMSLHSVKKLFHSIPNETPIDMRDKAIVALLMTTGARHNALISLPIGCVHLQETYYIDQNPRKGVNTKNKKRIVSVIVNIDKEFTHAIKHWYEYLRTQGYGDLDPFFPKAKQAYNRENHCFANSKDVEPAFFASHTSLCEVIRKRCKNAGLPYFSPHKFRHLLVKTVKELNLSSKESKCFSQSLGHEHEETTYGTYGKFNEQEVINTVSSIQANKTESHVRDAKSSFMALEQNKKEKE